MQLAIASPFTGQNVFQVCSFGTRNGFLHCEEITFHGLHHRTYPDLLSVCGSVYASVNHYCLSPQVLHIPDIDYHSNCLSLSDCLHSISSFSSSHPQHLPIILHLELPAVVPVEARPYMQQITPPLPVDENVRRQICRQHIARL